MDENDLKNKGGVAESSSLGQESEKEIKELKESRRALMNILEDVEDARKKAEEERDKTQLIITNFSDGLLVFDQENNLSLANPQVEASLGEKAEDLSGRHISELKEVKSFSSLIALLEAGNSKGIFRKELQLRENMILEVSSVPIMSGGEKAGTLVVLHDVTREKMVERMKTEFVSLSAHQLRTPLSAIKWTLRMLLDGDLGIITKDQREFIEKTYKSNERMINLVNALLNITRIEEGRYLYKPVPTDITPITESVINQYKEEAERKKIQIELNKPKKKTPKVLVDIEKITLVIQNLFENSLIYTQPGGKVTASLKIDNGEIEFSVKDTGVGIPKEQQERIFTKFFRGANVVRMDTEGTGLGLFTSKNIIEAHGGKIWFESEAGKGTTFFFTLPVAKEHSPETAKEEQK